MVVQCVTSHHIKMLKHAYMHERIHIHTHTHIYIYIYIYTHHHIRLHIHAHIHTCMTLHCTTLHYITLRYVTSHYITLNYITLHRDTHDIAQPNDRTLFLVGRCFSIIGSVFWPSKITWYVRLISSVFPACHKAMMRKPTIPRIGGTGESKKCQPWYNGDSRSVPRIIQWWLEVPSFRKPPRVFFLFQPFSTLESKGHIKHQQYLCFQPLHMRNQIPGVPCGSANNIASKQLCLDWSWLSCFDGQPSQWVDYSTNKLVTSVMACFGITTRLTA